MEIETLKQAIDYCEFVTIDAIESITKCEYDIKSTYVDIDGRNLLITTSFVYKREPRRLDAKFICDDKESPRVDELKFIM